jgi:putative membrane protein
MRPIVRILITMAALWAAAHWVSGISATGSWMALLGVALVFGVVNALVRPFVTLLSLPFVIVTLGFFFLVINALMLMLTSALSNTLGLGFHVAGFGPAFWGSIVISLVSWLLAMILPDGRRPDLTRSPPRGS